ncbi:MAG: hypothetical protein AAGD96_04465 [Chloroflexota bacterium]
MSRFTQSLQLDTKLQTKNQLYSITIVVAIAVGIALSYFFSQESLRIAIPVFFLFAAAGTGYLFIAALILFEKQEHTLDALIVTPLRPSEYLISKVLSLSLLVIIEGAVIVALAWAFWYGLDFGWPWLLGGLIAMQVIMTIFGIIVVVRYDKINDFLMPTFLVVMVTQLPFTAAIGLWEPFFFYIIPTYPPFLLMRAAFETIPTWQIIYGIVASAAWIGGLYYWAFKAFDKHIIQA